MNFRAVAVRLVACLAATLIVPLPASAQAVLSVSPTSINIGGSEGAAIDSQSVNVSNAGSRRLRWSVASPSASWLTVSPTSGSNSGTITVSFPSAFPAGTHAASFRVQDQRSSAFVTVNVVLTINGAPDPAPAPPSAPVPPPAPPPPSGSAVGPQSSITCPSGAVDIWPGTSIQGMVNANGGGTTFCLKAGTHPLTSSITPKSGDTFVGEYGAALDGSGWSTGDDTQAAFRSHNQDIDYVTIRNLVIRNMPQRGIHAYYYMSDHWTIEYNEIAYSKNTGILFPSDSSIRNNYIHHNAFSGYMGPYVHNSTIENNEISYNGWEQKVAESSNVTFRNNFVHHNVGVGIWFDSNNTGALVEGNRVEDNGHIGVFYEISSNAVIRNNTISRNADAGVFLGTSRSVEIYGNTIENNFRGITFFLNCPSLGGGSINFDLTNNSAHDNTITVGTQSGAFAALFSYASCTTSQVDAYLNGSKSLKFSSNTYHVPSLSGYYWLWVTTKYWGSWQSIPQDSSSSIQ